MYKVVFTLSCHSPSQVDRSTHLSEPVLALELQSLVAAFCSQMHIIIIHDQRMGSVPTCKAMQPIQVQLL